MSALISSEHEELMALGVCGRFTKPKNGDCLHERWEVTTNGFADSQTELLNRSWSLIARQTTRARRRPNAGPPSKTVARRWAAAGLIALTVTTDQRRSRQVEIDKSGGHRHGTNISMLPQTRALLVKKSSQPSNLLNLRLFAADGRRVMGEGRNLRGRAVQPWKWNAAIKSGNRLWRVRAAMPQMRTYEI